MAAIGQIIYNLEAYNTRGGLVSTREDMSGDIVSTDTTYEANKINIFADQSKQTSGATDKDIVALTGGKNFSKLGIQAPPGTKLVINKTNTDTNGKTILIGRSGVYEPDEDIEISYLAFKRKNKYILDQVSTSQAQENGKSQLQTAENIRSAKINSGLVYAGVVESKPSGAEEAPEGATYSITNNKIYKADGSEWTPDGGWSTSAVYVVKITTTSYHKLTYSAGIQSLKGTEAYWTQYAAIQTEYISNYNNAMAIYVKGLNGIYQLPYPEEEESYSGNCQDVLNIIVDYIQVDE